MLHIVIATRNRGKFRELARLLAVPGIRWHSLREFPGAPTVEETGRTFDANAIAKAKAAARSSGHAALADDSGLEVEALGWKPGVRSARFAGRQGDDRANNTKLLRVLKDAERSRRRARYRCSLALVEPRGGAGGVSASVRGATSRALRQRLSVERRGTDATRLIALTRGTWTGRIAPAPRGSGGFGYDPLFLVPRFGKTVGQLPASLKRRLSHRAQAARRLRPILRRLTRRDVGGRRPGRITGPRQTTAGGARRRPG